MITPSRTTLHASLVRPVDTVYMLVVALQLPRVLSRLHA